jgi:FkbM family methyltransferase
MGSMARRTVRLLRGRYPGIDARLIWRQRAASLDFQLMGRFVKRNGIAVDIGANWGLYTWRMASLVGPSGRVHCFEPDPSALASLTRIADSNANVKVHAMALSDRSGKAILYVPHFENRRLNALGTINPRRDLGGVTYEKVDVATESLDTALAAEPREISFIKCDVEGHELKVLRGGPTTLRCLPPLLIEIEQRHYAEGSISTTIEHLLGLGYRGFALFDDGVRPIEEFNLERHQLSFLTEEFVPFDMPQGYVHDFLFVSPTVDRTDVEAINRRVSWRR